MFTRRAVPSGRAQPAQQPSGCPYRDPTRSSRAPTGARDSGVVMMELSEDAAPNLEAAFTT
jgi:hypothetical protein